MLIKVLQSVGLAGRCQDSPPHPWYNADGAVGTSPRSELRRCWSSRNSQGPHPKSHEVKGLLLASKPGNTFLKA